MGIFLPHQHIGIKFQHRQTGGDFLYISSCLCLENIPQIVCHIRADKKGIAAFPGAAHRVRRRHAGLADAALSCDDVDSAHSYLFCGAFAHALRSPGFSLLFSFHV